MSDTRHRTSTRHKDTRRLLRVPETAHNARGANATTTASDFLERNDPIPVGPEAERGRLEFGGICERRGAPGGAFRSVRSETDRLFIC